MNQINEDATKRTYMFSAARGKNMLAIRLTHVSYMLKNVRFLRLTQNVRQLYV